VLGTPPALILSQDQTLILISGSALRCPIVKELSPVNSVPGRKIILRNSLKQIKSKRQLRRFFIRSTVQPELRWDR
jgi:hypothetical protein